MLLSNLLENVDVESIKGSVDIAVQNVAFDTKDVVEGSVFVCLKDIRRTDICSLTLLWQRARLLSCATRTFTRARQPW